ncbi:MAG: hypothetical protein RR922_04185 [Clostridia bacterium]
MSLLTKSTKDRDEYIELMEKELKKLQESSFSKNTCKEKEENI